MKTLLFKILPIVDLLLVPFLLPAAGLMKLVRRIGVQRLPFCKQALLKVGVFPLREHYYEPQFNFPELSQPLDQDRKLIGVTWNPQEQVALLDSFTYADELSNLAMQKGEELNFYLHNNSFEAGDAEYWYQLLRAKKPKRIIEIGSGHSTLMASKALKKNSEQDPAYRCHHVCIEPYEMPWLEKTGVTVVRKKVEDVALDFFAELEENDVLFIDSSHMIRPQGDVLFEYLELLPSLKRGVIVHIHDIFTPRNYPAKWVVNEVRFWNEQYLLEAFLSDNQRWTILGALNHLHHHHAEAFKRVAPFVKPANEPGSFYIQKIAD